MGVGIKESASSGYFKAVLMTCLLLHAPPSHCVCSVLSGFPEPRLKPHHSNTQHKSAAYKHVCTEADKKGMLSSEQSHVLVFRAFHRASFVRTPHY